ETILLVRKDHPLSTVSTACQAVETVPRLRGQGVRRYMQLQGEGRANPAARRGTSRHPAALACPYRAQAGRFCGAPAARWDGQPLEGQFLHTARTVNTMVDQLSSFASEVTRVAREVGAEGKLGGQADVKGVAGTWKDLTDSVNMMAGNLTAQVRNIAEVTTA